MPKRTILCRQCSKRKPQREFTYLHRNAETKACAKSNLCWDCQRQSPTPNPMSGYGQRDAILRAMGFGSYADYLASDLWSGIRLRVLKLRNFTCQSCGERATQVHHNVYGRRELSGQSLKGMKALCGACHKQVEFDGARKVGVIEASHRAVSMV